MNFKTEKIKESASLKGLRPFLFPSGKESLPEAWKKIFKAPSPSRRRRGAGAKPVGKTGEPARRVRPTQTVVPPSFGNCQIPFVFSLPHDLFEILTSYASSSQRILVGRTSDEGGRGGLSKIHERRGEFV